MTDHDSAQSPAEAYARAFTGAFGPDDDLHIDADSWKVARDEILKILDENAALRAQLEAADAIFDKFDLFTVHSNDSGKTWVKWTLAERIELACRSALDDEDAKRAESAEARLREAEKERDLWKADANSAKDGWQAACNTVTDLEARLREAETPMEELWKAVKEMQPDLGDLNKPLAIAASYALLRNRLRECEADAERYLYIRDAGKRDYTVIMEKGGAYLKMGDALDAAITKAKGG